MRNLSARPVAATLGWIESPAGIIIYRLVRTTASPFLSQNGPLSSRKSKEPELLKVGSMALGIPTQSPSTARQSEPLNFKRRSPGVFLMDVRCALVTSIGHCEPLRLLRLNQREYPAWNLLAQIHISNCSIEKILERAMRFELTTLTLASVDSSVPTLTI